MNKKITSFSMDEDVIILLKLISKKEGRSQSNMIQTLIKEAAIKARIKSPK